MSLRARLSWTYGAAVFFAVLMLAIVALTAIDRSLRSSLDARLSTAGAAANALLDVHHGRLFLDKEDRRQLAEALGGSMDAAMFTRDGAMFAASSNAVPPVVLATVAAHPNADGLYSAGSGDRALRVALETVERDSTVYGTIAVWEGSDYIDEYDRSAIIAIALGALGIGGGVVMLSSTLARRALAPLERFTALATEIEAHDLSRRVGTQGSTELRRLGSAFDRMLDRLQGAFVRQRQFTADASHELRAPLAVIRAEAEVALGKERTPEDYRRALATIVDEVDRIDHLVDALLVAARADASSFEFEPLDLAELASLSVQRFAPAAQARHITLQPTIDPAMIVGDGRALERALAALLHNAIDHASSRIELRVQRHDRDVELTVADDGAGFSPEGLVHATERFWRDDPARRRGGTGLGLSIVEAIGRAHGARIELSNRASGGAKVTLHFPFIGPSSP
ncbi:MAG TPA: ATP-binding protein [Candidatus Aquilonibacter sp.]|nr:ATP-binding protein [Candidatus Aquilonibacter sp.]